MWASNPDMEIDGHYHPYFNTSESKPDAPAKEKGFLIAEEKNKISYPSLWIKNTDLNQFTGVHSIPIINFLIPDLDSATSKRSTVGIAKYIIDGNHTASSSSSSSLFDYVKEELNELESNVSFQLNESAPSMLSNIKNGAKECGLLIPKTVMSNNKEEIVSFWEMCNGNCIYKTFTPPLVGVAETRNLSEEDRALR